jgi:septal ring factor EnvC (AmiA/AmiB activator)
MSDNEVQMNPYEVKFKDHFMAATTLTKQIIQKSQDTENKIMQACRDLDSLDASLNLLEDQVAKDAITAKMDSLREDIKSLNRLLETYKRQGTENSNKIRILQEVCPHTETVWDHDNPHTREDYYRCTLCNSVN